MAGRKRANKIQVNVREPSGMNRDGWNRSRNMDLDIAPLTTETGTSPETHDNPGHTNRAERSLREARIPG